MTVFMGRIANQEKYRNGCHLKTTSQNYKIFDVHIWGTCVHMCTKYEVSKSNPVLGGCAQMPMLMLTPTPTPTQDDDAQWTKHDCIRLFG